MRRLFCRTLARQLGAFAVLVALAIAPAFAQNRYRVTNLVSDGSIPGTKVDPNLVDPWGLAFDPYGYAWVASPASGAITRYDGNGNFQPPVIRTSGPNSGVPVGLAFNGSQNYPTVNASGKTGPSRFMITTEAGSLHGWNGSVDPDTAFQRYASIYIPTYTGIAFSGCCGRQLLYVVWPAWRIIVFESNFRRTTMPEGAFYDAGAEGANLFSYNIQAIGGNLYITYANHDSGRRAIPGAGSGLVNVFTPSGRFIRRIVTGGPLNAPWGMALAPAEFGIHSNRLLVGNTGDGRINVFDPTTGQHHGALLDSAGNPIVIDGLHSLQFGNGVANQSVNTLYFTAGPSNGTRGLYGRIDLIR
ncbi:MAG: TIGR03118 family protein [Luteimonas sp.]|nr:TIGR03118 family protein [Luteimonas sp.]